MGRRLYDPNPTTSGEDDATERRILRATTILQETASDYHTYGAARDQVAEEVDLPPSLLEDVAYDAFYSEREAA